VIKLARQKTTSNLSFIFILPAQKHQYIKPVATKTTNQTVVLVQILRAG